MGKHFFLLHSQGLFLTYCAHVRISACIYGIICIIQILSVWKDPLNSWIMKQAAGGMEEDH